jgi:hypothetical protein
MDQLIIGDKASLDDFAASVASRKIKLPKKKSIKETVPFSNVTHDFSAIDGETYWEERELEYIFEITADDPEELEELKGKFAAWVMGVMGQELHDPHIPDYHFLATYDDMDPEDDEGLDKCTLTVKFTAYPYKIADTPKVYETTLTASKWRQISILNESDHPVSLTIENSMQITVGIGSDGAMSPIPKGSGTYSALKLPKGSSTVFLSNSESKDGTVRISFKEEVF